MADTICEYQRAHIGTLATHEAKINTIEKKVDNLDEMKENLKLLTYLQQKSDERAVRFENIYEQQIKTNIEVTSALKSINNNMESMNTELKEHSSKVDRLENTFNENEGKQVIKIENVRNNAEIIKSRFTFYGVLATSILSLLAIAIGLFFK